MCYALKDTVRAEYERFYQMVNDGRLSEFQVKEFNMIYNSLCQESIGKEIENHVIRSIAVLCQALSTYYGEKVFLLLDEYDTPFMSANSEGYYDEVKSHVESFSGNVPERQRLSSKGNSDRDSENCEGKYIFGSQ